MSPYTIHHVSSAPFSGGATRAGYRAHGALVDHGVNSFWKQVRTEAPEALNLENWSKPKGWKRPKRKGWGKRKKRNPMRAFEGCQTCATSPIGWGDWSFFSKQNLPDIYNFHWVAEFLDWSSVLSELTRQLPVVWTLHDLNPLRGAWHYDPMDSELSEERVEFDREAFRIKESALQLVDSARLVFVAPSVWMQHQCQQSELTKRFQCKHIPSGLDADEFYPIDRLTAKRALGIDPARQIVGFVADALPDSRKGIAELRAALKSMAGHSAPLLLAVGQSDTVDSPDSEIHLGRMGGSQLLRVFYSACDLFVCPSLQDNLPNTILEAMACGAPVVAFDTGGIPDMVRAGKSGVVVPYGDVQQLSTAMTELLADASSLKELGRSARQLVIEEYNLEKLAARYAELYESLLPGS